MDKGSIFDFVRETLADHFASDYDQRVLQINEKLVDSEDMFADRLNLYSQMYWDIAYQRKFFKLFICVECMSMYVTLGIVSILSYYIGLDFIEGAILFFASLFEVKYWID